MSKEFVLFEKDELTFKEKTLRLMDLLVSNKSVSMLECLILFLIFYIQILAGFFGSDVGVLDVNNSTSDEYLNTVQSIFRIRGLFDGSYTTYSIALYLLLTVLCL